MRATVLVAALLVSTLYAADLTDRELKKLETAHKKSETKYLKQKAELQAMLEEIDHLIVNRRRSTIDGSTPEETRQRELVQASRALKEDIKVTEEEYFRVDDELRAAKGMPSRAEVAAAEKAHERATRKERRKNGGGRR